jgi:1-acyl-sn-glycerol-3-phosphate acyltransferase
VWVGIALLLMIGSSIQVPLWILSPVLDRRRRSLWWVNTAMGRSIVALNPFWKVRVVGEARLPPGAFVICSSHSSNADPFCLAFLRGQVRYLAKRSLARVPFFGWMMLMGGHVLVERGDVASGAEALARCRRWLDRGIPVLFFPEGTRSETGELREFKMGAFKLAVEAGVPVLPVAIEGSHRALPKHGWIMRERVEVRLKVLPPIAPGADPVLLRQQTRAAIADAKAELRG